MSWSALTPTASGSFEIPPSGLKAGILVALIDLGTHNEEFKDPKTNLTTYRDVRKVYLVWELTGCKSSGTSNNHLIGRQYTMSLNEKAALRKVVKSWRGKDLKEGEAFDILVMLGKPFALTISHKEIGEKTYANLDGVGSLPEEMKALPAKRTPVSREIHSSDPMPDWLPRIYGERVEDVVGRAKERREPGRPPQTDPLAEDSIAF